MRESRKAALCEGSVPSSTEMASSKALLATKHARSGLLRTSGRGTLYGEANARGL